MNINDIFDTAAKLTQRSDLLEPDNISILYFYANKVKLEFQRNHKLRYCGNTIILSVTDSLGSIALPSDFLRSNVIYRQKGTIDSGEERLYQFIRKYTSLEKFREHYPIFNEDDTLNKGPVTDYILHGLHILFGPFSDRAETLRFDYDRKLPDYAVLTNEEDIISIIGYDFLLKGIIAEIYTSWVFDDKKAAVWQGFKARAESELVMLNTAEMESGRETRQLELYGENRRR